MSSKPAWLNKAKERKAGKKQKDDPVDFLSEETTVATYRQVQGERPSDVGFSAPLASETPVVSVEASPITDMGEKVENSQDQSLENLGLNQPEVKTTSGQINPSPVEIIETIHLDSAADLGSKEPQVDSTSGQNDLRSEKPQVEKTPGEIVVPKKAKKTEKSKPRVEKTSGQVDTRLVEYQGTDRGSYVSLPDEMNEALFDLNKREQTVMRFLLRYSYNFKRCFVEASAGFIADGTGLGDTSNVRKALKALVASGMIVLEKEGNSAGLQPPIWRVPWVESWMKAQGMDVNQNAPTRLTRYSNRNLGSEKPQVKGTSGQNNPGLGSIQPQPRVEMTVASGQNDPQELQSESSVETQKNPLPLAQALPFKIKQHLERCPAKMKAAEENALASLLGPIGKSLEEVSRAFEKAVSRTIKGEPIRFPLMFMATNDSAFYGINVKVSPQTLEEIPNENSNEVTVDSETLVKEFLLLPQGEQEKFIGPLRRFNLETHTMLLSAAQSYFAGNRASIAENV